MANAALSTRTARIGATALTTTYPAARWQTWGLRGVQGLLAALFLFAGGAKFFMPPEAMEASGLLLWFLRFIGVCEVAGALGLVLPGLTGIATRLVPLAAAGLTCIMVGAVVMTAAAGGPLAAAFPFATGALLVLVVIARTRAARTRFARVPSSSASRP